LIRDKIAKVGEWCSTECQTLFNDQGSKISTQGKSTVSRPRD